ncbi:MAG: CRISPR-associated endonuclease Cas2 [Anaerolineales bacterium]|nr:CRISPR-associated endonuclease Cas2 [Anaerolineales bacterium]
MNCLLLYDIPDDKVRTKVADACLDYGLDRLQYSAFHGDISRNYQAELFLKVTALLGSLPGNIQLIPICKKDWQQRQAFITAQMLGL